MFKEALVGMMPQTIENQIMAMEILTALKEDEPVYHRVRVSELAKEHGVSNLIFSMPLSLISDNDLDPKSPMVDFVSEEGYNRKLADGYKLNLVSVEEYMRRGFFGWSRTKLSREFYVMDFESLMDRHPAYFKVRFTCTDVH